MSSSFDWFEQLWFKQSFNFGLIVRLLKMFLKNRLIQELTWFKQSLLFCRPLFSSYLPTNTCQKTHKNCLWKILFLFVIVFTSTAGEIEDCRPCSTWLFVSHGSKFWFTINYYMCNFISLLSNCDLENKLLCCRKKDFWVYLAVLVWFFLFQQLVYR